jgi:hypothetical protein
MLVAMNKLRLKIQVDQKDWFLLISTKNNNQMSAVLPIGQALFLL